MSFGIRYSVVIDRVPWENQTSARHSRIFTYSGRGPGIFVRQLHHLHETPLKCNSSIQAKLDDTSEFRRYKQSSLIQAKQVLRRPIKKHVREWGSRYWTDDRNHSNALSSSTVCDLSVEFSEQTPLIKFANKIVFWFSQRHSNEMEFKWRHYFKFKDLIYIDQIQC